MGNILFYDIIEYLQRFGILVTIFQLLKTVRRAPKYSCVHHNMPSILQSYHDALDKIKGCYVTNKLSCLLQNHALPIPQILKPNILKLALPANLIPRLHQRLLKGPHPPPQKPINESAALLDLVVCRNPVPRLQHPLRKHAVLRAEIQLLRRADADIVQAMQERKDAQLRVGGREGCQGRVRDAVGRVYDGLGGFGGDGGEGFVAVAVYGERGALLARCSAQEGVCCKGYEECGVVV